MKSRKITALVLASLMVVSLFALSGCGEDKADNNTVSTKVSEITDNSVETQENAGKTEAEASNLDKEESIKKLHFHYSSKYVIKNTSETGKMVENENNNTIISYQEGKNSDELAQSRGMEFVESKDINGTEWKKYSYSDDQVETVIFMYEEEGGTYVVTISHEAGLDVDLSDYIEEFMDGVRFE